MPSTTSIIQQPAFSPIPVGQDIIYTVSNTPILATQERVKYVAKVWISTLSINPAADTPIGTFKTTPNNRGTGVFNFRQLAESYVKSDNLAAKNSQYKTAFVAPESRDVPIHNIDKYSVSTNLVKNFLVQFSVEYLGATDCAGSQDDDVVRISCGSESNAADQRLYIMNGYIKHSDVLNWGAFPNNSGFGFKMNNFYLTTDEDSALTNLPTTLYAQPTDYGTLALWVRNTANLSKIKFQYKRDTGATLNIEYLEKNSSNGAFTNLSGIATKQVLFFGAYPANIRQWSDTFDEYINDGTIGCGSIEITAWSEDDVAISKTYSIKLINPQGKGYEPIRLCWLNQWGAWDYFTFNMKSTRTISKKESTYEPLAGTWNDYLYLPHGFTGGTRTFRVNATEKITINTDVLPNQEPYKNNIAVMRDNDYNPAFEELMNSPEVYKIEGYKTDSADEVITTYVTPVRMLSQNFTKKTSSNDGVVQYTFEIEIAKELRTQTV
tara:strand:- start:3042 stop:4520 length:1479 start_codon:yes stop_codon:yes gene_type:complete